MLTPLTNKLTRNVIGAIMPLNTLLNWDLCNELARFMHSSRSSVIGRTRHCRTPFLVRAFQVDAGASSSKPVSNVACMERDPANPVHFRTVHGVGYKFVR